MSTEPILKKVGRPKGRRSYYSDDTIQAALKASGSIMELATLIGMSYRKTRDLVRDYKHPSGVTYHEYYTKNRKRFNKKRKIRRYAEKQERFYNILAGRLPSSSMGLRMFINMLFIEHVLEQKCENCGYCKKRYDGSVPLVISFRDGNARNWTMENLRVYCHNCHYYHVDDEEFVVPVTIIHEYEIKGSGDSDEDAMDEVSIDDIDPTILKNIELMGLGSFVIPEKKSKK